MPATSGCWRAYTDSLAWEYSHYVPGAENMHPLAVDAYAASHAESDDPRNVQSVAVHAASLYLHLRRDRSLEYAHRMKKYLVEEGGSFEVMVRPDFSRALNVGDAPEGPTYAEWAAFVRSWAASVLDAWLVDNEAYIVSLCDRAERD